MTPVSVFTLGRMRHLDLLALYFRLYSGMHGRSIVDPMGAASSGTLVEAILQAQAGEVAS